MTNRSIDPGTRREGRRSRRVRVLVLLAGLAVAALQTACVSIDLLGDAGDAPLEETVVAGRKGPKILLVEIDGMISNAEMAPSFFGLPSESMVARVREVLDRAREDDEVAGILLRVDSPGGTATASEQIYTEIDRFKRERGVPVVAQLLGTAASGGYYVAMAADRVQVHPTTVVGSIGVIFSSLNFSGLMEKLGVADQTITGGEFKDIGSPFRPLTDEERSQLQSIVDDLHGRFKEVVGRGRPELTPEQVESLANGRIYSARQARENGLVDSIGTLREAVRALADRVGAPNVRVVAYHRPNVPRRNLYMRSRAPAGFGVSGGDPLGGEAWSALAGSELVRELLVRPGFHYLWWPGLRGLGR